VRALRLDRGTDGRELLGIADRRPQPALGVLPDTELGANTVEAARSAVQALKQVAKLSHRRQRNLRVFSVGTTAWKPRGDPRRAGTTRVMCESGERR
jgi:hypothetical protein